MTSAEERREGIALVLDQRPEMDLDELQALLSRAGVEVDLPTLLEDLDALGYDVDDEAPEEPGVLLDDPDDLGEEPHEASHRPWSWVVGAVAAVVLLAIAAFVLLGDDGGDDETAGGDVPSETTVVQSGGGDPTTEDPGTTASVPVAPVGPGSDPALDVPETLTDDFERSGIGDFPGVSPWETLGGAWENTDGNLDLVLAPLEGLSVATIDVGSADVRAQVQVDRPASRAGIAFRIVDGANLYLWAPVPEIRSVILYEVVDGEATPVADSGYAEPGDGMPALGINLVGETAELLLDGVVVATYDQLPPVDEDEDEDDGATRIGVAVLGGGEGLPLFDEYRVLVP